MKGNPGFGMNNLGMGMDNLGFGVNNPGFGMNNPGFGMNNPGVGMNNPAVGSWNHEKCRVRKKYNVRVAYLRIIYIIYNKIFLAQTTRKNVY